MKYLLIIPFTDLADERPRVATKFFEAATEEEAIGIANEIAGVALRLMDLAVCDWREEEAWKDLDGKGLLREAGYAFGAVDVWCGESLLHLAETGFGPCDLEQHEGSTS